MSKQHSNGALRQFYGVGEELTNTPNMKLITRSTQHNRVYYVTDTVYRVVMDHYKAVTEKKDCLRVRSEQRYYNNVFR